MGDRDGVGAVVSGHSPCPWRFDDEPHSANVLRAANGVSVALLDVRVDEAGCAAWKADRDLLASAPELLAMLRELEWAGTDPDGVIGACPTCGRSKPMLGFPSKYAPHDDDCRLAALLARFK